MHNRTSGPTVAGQADPPFLTVVRGHPDETELAALVTVLAARVGAAAAAAAQPPRSQRTGSSRWSDRSRLLREPVAPGPGAWRRSALPA